MKVKYYFICDLDFSITLLANRNQERLVSVTAPAMRTKKEFSLY